MQPVERACMCSEYLCDNCRIGNVQTGAVEYC